MVLLEVEEEEGDLVEGEEEELVKGEAKLSTIIVDNWDTMLDIVQILHRRVHIVKCYIILSRNVHKLLLNGNPRSLGIRINSQMQIKCLEDVS